MKIRVLHSQWAAEDQVFEGETVVEKPSAKLLKLAAGAEAAGDIKVTASADERAKMAAHVESDAESLKAQASAVKSGDWQRSNLEHFVVDAGHRIAVTEDETQRAYLKQGVADAKAILKADG